MEIEASLIRKPSVIRVYFLDGTFRYIPVQSWITVGDLSKGLAGALGIQDDQSFALFKISSDEVRVRWQLFRSHLLLLLTSPPSTTTHRMKTC